MFSRHPPKKRTTRTTMIEQTPRCTVCRNNRYHRRCESCEVRLFCRRHHLLVDHMNEHNRACYALESSRERLELQENVLLAHFNEFTTLADLFSAQMNPSGDVEGIESYLEARHGLVQALRRFKTPDAVRAALDHALDILRLNCSDITGVRHLVPALFLRLGRDHDCYAFVKWDRIDCREQSWELKYISRHLESSAFESVDYLCRDGPYTSHLSAIILIKIKLFLDLRSLQASRVLADRLPREILELIQSYIPQSTIISSNTQMMRQENWDADIEEMLSQVHQMYTAGNELTKGFWQDLVDYEHEHDSYAPFPGVSVPKWAPQWCFDAWIETPQAVKVMKALLGGKI